MVAEQNSSPDHSNDYLSAGQMLGPFQIEARLAYDLFGALYRALDTASGKPCCLHVLPPQLCQDKQFQQRFKTHSKNLLGLDHPNILAYQDKHDIGGTLVYRLEAFEGQNMADTLQNSSADADEMISDSAAAMNPDQVQPILEKVLEVLQYIHKLGLLHLNLNPTNVLINAQGQVKVAGIGLMDMAGVKLLDAVASAGIAPLKTKGKIIKLNTVDILSPEMRLGKKGDRRSDIYALGMTAYWLLTGQKPKASYRAPSEINSAVSAGWNIFIARCLERDSTKRYPSAAAALKELENVDSLKPGNYTPDPGTGETRSVFKHLERLTKAPFPAQSDTKGKSKAPVLAAALLLVVLLAAGAFFFIGGGDDPAEQVEERIAVRASASEAPPNARFILTPKEATITLANTEKINDTSGRIDLVLAQGEHLVEVSLPDHVPFKQKLTFTEELQTIRVNLQPKLADVTIRSVPGTTIIATRSGGQATELGTVPEGGELRIKDALFEDDYTFLYTNNDYKDLTIDGIKVLFGESNIQKVNLAPLPAQVLITGEEPTNLTIYSGTEELGTTPVTVKNLEAGTPVTFRYEHPNFEAGEFTLQLKPNEQATYTIPSLDLKIGTAIAQVTLAGKQPTSSDSITVQVERVGTENQPQALIPQQAAELKVGDYVATITHPDYFESTQTFAVRPDEQTTFTANLAPKPGKLTVLMQPEDTPVQIEVNGQQPTLNDNGALLLPANEPVQIRVMAQDFYILNKSMTLAPNEDEEWRAELIPLPAPTLEKDYTVPYVGIALKWIPEGQIKIGSPLQENRRRPEEGPPTTVESDGFWAGQTEVTQAQYAYIMGNNPGLPKHPVVPVNNISMLDAQAFADKLTATERAAGRIPKGYSYRLPTEAEWEYLARAGTRTAFHFGDKADPSFANVQSYYPETDEPDNVPAAKDKLVPAGTYPPSPWGLTEVHGNVSEWTCTPYTSRLPGGTIQANELEAQKELAEKYMLRGGSYIEPARLARSASRGGEMIPQATDNTIGMRIVLAPHTVTP